MRKSTHWRVARWRSGNLPAGRQALEEGQMYFVYILKSLRNGEFYKGLTDNIERRLREHLQGTCISTKNGRPFKLVHVEICSSRENARKIEKFFKSGYGREIIKELDIR